jgi:hypothetical protein
MEDRILDAKESPQPTSSWTTLVLVLLPLIVANMILHINLPRFERPFREKIYFAVLTFPVLIPLIGFSLGLLFAFVPYRKLPYRAKYLKASLLAMIALEVLMLIGEGMRYVGH